MRTLTLAWQAHGQWQSYTITAECPCVIGRQAEVCQIVLDDRSVSRQHASISAVDGAFHLRNLSQMLRWKRQIKGSIRASLSLRQSAARETEAG